MDQQFFCLKYDWFKYLFIFAGSEVRQESILAKIPRNKARKHFQFVHKSNAGESVDFRRIPLQESKWILADTR